MKKLLKNAHIIDGLGNEFKGSIEIENERINKVYKDESFSNDYDEIIDCQGKSVIPGMMNAHVHLCMNPYKPAFDMNIATDADLVLECIENAKRYINTGFTFVRDLGNNKYIELGVRDAIKQGRIDGPDILCAGRMITMTGGHGHSIGIEVDGIVEAQRAARENFKRGADCLKIMATGGVLTPGVNPKSTSLDEDEIRAAVREAKKRGLTTASHAQGTEGIKNAIRAGISSIEHGIFLDDEACDLMIEYGTYFVPTLVAPHFILEAGVEKGVDKQAVDKCKWIYDAHRESTQKAMKKGVKFALGTDAGTPYNAHERSCEELFLLHKYGMSEMDTIVTATKNTAELFQVIEDYGTIEENKYADLVILSENPLKNLETLRDVEIVFKKGKKVYSK